ncbi:MAG: hypothetical protein QOH49_1663 [Acidobacteriota bacterium]|jgi:hypothetical protein|nr:hypothetical protein [Acidobacteriota bacterium]
MSEEKPNFKVTDRRLFNPDGTPRDIPREEEPAPTPEPVPQQAATPAPEPPAPEPPRAATPSEAATPRAPEGEETPEAHGEAQGDEGFLMLVEFLASFAADALGMVNHPGGGGVNLQLAKQCIDMLGTLARKTQGNLVGEEQQFLDMILSQLRMQYVSLSSAPRPPQGGGGGGRGFTGGDITGGR